MGAYEMLPNGQQVKCWWCEMRGLNFGDTVPEIDNQTSYSIALREGGFANVSDNIFVSVTEKPDYAIVFDKWGNLFKESTKGLISELFEDEYLFQNENIEKDVVK